MLLSTSLQSNYIIEVFLLFTVNQTSSTLWIHNIIDVDIWAWIARVKIFFPLMSIYCDVFLAIQYVLVFSVSTD